jgi:hypothetical protein
MASIYDAGTGELLAASSDGYSTHLYNDVAHLGCRLFLDLFNAVYIDPALTRDAFPIRWKSLPSLWR